MSFNILFFCSSCCTQHGHVVNMACNHLFACYIHPPEVFLLELVFGTCNSLCTNRRRALLKGTLVGFFIFILFLSSPPAPPKHLPCLGCVALPRLSHQAPRNLTCFSHFLQQRERERETEAARSVEGGGRQPEVCAREVKINSSGLKARPCSGAAGARIYT